VIEAIDTEGVTISEEALTPPPRQRTPDPSPEVQARQRYRENFDLVFGRKLWLPAKGGDHG